MKSSGVVAKECEREREKMERWKEGNNPKKVTEERRETEEERTRPRKK